MRLQALALNTQPHTARNMVDSIPEHLFPLLLALSAITVVAGLYSFARTLVLYTHQCALHFAVFEFVHVEV